MLHLFTICEFYTILFLNFNLLYNLFFQSFGTNWISIRSLIFDELFPLFNSLLPLFFSLLLSLFHNKNKTISIFHQFLCYIVKVLSVLLFEHFISVNWWLRRSFFYYLIQHFLSFRWQISKYNTMLILWRWYIADSLDINIKIVVFIWIKTNPRRLDLYL